MTTKLSITYENGDTVEVPTRLRDDQVFLAHATLADTLVDLLEPQANIDFLNRIEERMPPTVPQLEREHACNHCEDTGLTHTGAYEIWDETGEAYEHPSGRIYSSPPCKFCVKGRRGKGTRWAIVGRVGSDDWHVLRIYRKRADARINKVLHNARVCGIRAEYRVVLHVEWM